MTINKKGIELQFHWIFILIAGALILGFFLSFALKQRVIGQERLQYTLLSQVDDILAKSQLKGGIAQSIPTPAQGIGFSCTQGCDCIFQIDNANRPFSQPIFAPELLIGQDTFIWSLEWKQPYRVTNFLYLTNPNVKYYFVYDEGKSQSRTLHQELTKNIPPPIIQENEILTNFNYENITLGEINSLEAEDYDYHKFVFINVPAQTPAKFSSKEATAISINEQSITFLSKTRRQNTFQENDVQRHIGIPSIYAAIFSQDSSMYSCGIEQALHKLSTISKILAKRAGDLQAATLCSETGGGCILGAPITICQNPNLDVCSGSPTGIIGLLCQQHDLSSQLLSKLDVNGLDLLKNRLDTENRKLLQQSCPEVF